MEHKLGVCCIEVVQLVDRKYGLRLMLVESDELEGWMLVGFFKLILWTIFLVEL